MNKCPFEERGVGGSCSSARASAAYRQNPLPPKPPVPDRAPLLQRWDRAVFVTAEPAIKWCLVAWIVGVFLWACWAR